MKKILFLIILAFLSTIIYASPVEDYLNKAIKAYGDGDISTAIDNIDAARKILDKEQLSQNQKDYIEVSSWDIIKLKRKDYYGKKIKVRLTYCGVASNGMVSLLPCYCSYNDSLIEKISTLTKWEEYTFYGTVTENYVNLCLHIEAIEK